MSLAARASSELWTTQTAAAADRHTMGCLGIPSPLLMERAALCVAHEVATLRAQTGGPVLVLCGPGNNGGDGLALCRQLFGWEIPATALLVPGTSSEAVAEQLALCRSFGVTVRRDVAQLPAAAIVVDALLGTGSVGAPRGAVAKFLVAQRCIDGPRVAVDLPTGVDADTGSVHPDAFVADLTVTFVRAKLGLLVTPGRHHAGRIVVADIGLLGEPDRSRGQTLVAPGWVARVLSRLPDGAHKGQRGHLGIVGGSAGTPGAAVLAGAGALRAGAGLVTIATDDHEVSAQLVAHRPELMVCGRGEAPLLPGASALCVGPGLTQASDRRGIADLWRTDPRPAVFDASALDEVPLSEPPHGRGARVLTPHPGEAARLLTRAFPDDPWSSARVQAHRVEAVRRLAGCTGAVTVLKGEGTLVATPGDTTGVPAHVHVVVTGSAALATAGSGDVLAGLLGALMARGVAAAVAAPVAAHVHGLAGERLEVGAAAMDVADAVAHAIGEVQTAAGRKHLRWPTVRRG